MNRFKISIFILFSVFLQTSHAQTFYAGGEHKSTADLFYPEQWKSKELKATTDNIAGNFNISAGVSKNYLDAEFDMSQKLQGYFWGNGNMVFVAAKANGIKIPKAEGSYSLEGKYYFLHSTQFTVKKDIKFSENFKIRLEPHIFSIHDFHYGESNLNINVKGKAGVLRGTLNRVGTRSFGILRDEKDDSGWGWGLNFSADYQLGPLAFNARVENLLSQLRFSTIHYSDRTYNASVQGGSIYGAGDNLALTGRYNYKSTTMRLPVLTNIGVRHDSFDNFSVGAYSLGNVVVPWVNMDFRYQDFGFSISSMKFKNLMLSLSWMPQKNFQAGVGLHYTKESSVQLASMYARYEW